MSQLSLFEPIIIPLTRGYDAIVDPLDSDLRVFKWHAVTGQRSKTVYAQRREYATRHYFKMHRVILERILGRPLASGEQVDHIDGDGLNNRRGNLRLATTSTNQQNRAMQKNNTSGYKGVSLHSEGKWQATIGANGKHKYLGLYETPQEAHAAYCEEARRLHGEFAHPDKSKEGD